jgi:hypothetical protein
MARLSEAREVLKDRVRKAYRHYAYLTRKGDQLEVVFARFDDDKQTALNGNDVWGALVGANRAVGEYYDPAVKARKRKPLSEQYVATLLSAFDRHLTLRDIVSSFYKNPRFPLVPKIDDIRDVIYKMLQEPSPDDPTTGGWELVGSDDSRLHVDNAKQIAISSSAQQIRKRMPAEPKDEGRGTDTDGETARGETQNGHITETDSSTRSGTPVVVKKKPESYSWYGVELPNRSIVDESKREEVAKLLRWLASQLDNDEFDHQLVSLKYEMMIGSNPVLAADVESRANALQAKIIVREEL